MSGVFKAIGKVFKKVAKVVKKIALPALAIGAVVLTGGAALGLLPSVGALAGSLGASAGLTSVLSSAATAATIGAGGALITGNDPIKGATAGFITGGAIGGIGALAGAAGGAAAGGAGAAGSSAGGSTFAKLLPQVTGGAGVPGVAAGGTIGQAATTAATTAGGAAGGGGGGIIGGIGRFVNQNPIVAGQLIQGIGSGISANEQMKERRRDIRRVEGNYSDTSNLFRSGGGGTPVDRYQTGAEKYDPVAYSGGRYRYDPNTGRILPVEQLAGAA